MSPSSSNSQNNDPSVRIAEEYRILHKVAQILQTRGELKIMLRDVMQAITGFEELKVENKAGIFIADEKMKVLRLFTTLGAFSDDFLQKEKEVPFGDCLCGRAAVTGELLTSESCFTDPRHERTYSGVKEHGHYIVPLKSGIYLVGIMFLYTDIHPAFYMHSKEVLLSIGGLIADAILRKQTEEELDRYRHSLEELVNEKTRELTGTNQSLADEIEGHKKTQEKLRNLSRQIQAVREEEKTRISREVHDELGQALTALKMDLHHLENKISGQNPEWREQFSSMTELVDGVIKSVQRIAMDLRPPVLDAFGLCEAIAWQADEFKKRFGIRFDLNCLEKHIDLDKELSTTLFRIFQETLTNIARHAKADRVQICLNLDHGKLILEINDNGKGIDEDQIKDSNSLGLIGIRERVRACNGEVSFLGAQGKGTRVKVIIPVAGS